MPNDTANIKIGGQTFSGVNTVSVTDADDTSESVVFSLTAGVASIGGSSGVIALGDNLSISGNTLSAAGTNYTAGTNIQISNNVISATDTTYSAGTNVQINNGVISATDTTYSAGTGIDITNSAISFSTPVITITQSQVTSLDPVTVQLTDAQYAIISDDKVSIIKLDVSDLGLWSNYWEKTQLGNQYVFVTPYFDEYSRGIIRVNKTTKVGILSTEVNNLTAGDNITIDSDDGTISATDTTYSAGTGISITSNTISNLDTYQTTAPTAAATDGRIHIVYLTSDPATKYDGYIYLINEA